MGVVSTQSFQYKLIASGSNGNVQLDLFKDEPILLSDNVTGLFDLGILPSDFTRQITVPGTKKNNAFFEHVYDISVYNPFLFETNKKVGCYLDFDGIYLADGYMQLNKVNVIANKFIDSYEVTIYGGLASFGRDLKRSFLTDLTSSLAQYNHTASLDNISASWSGNLLNGDIVYPLAEYGQRIAYAPEVNNYGIDEPSGSLCVQDFKPAIRVKKVWDAIFDTYGYTYSGSFWEQSWLDNVYLLANRQLKYPVFDEYDLETYGLFKIGPISGSGQTNVLMNNGVDLQIPWFNIQENPNNNLDSNLAYRLDFNTALRGEIKLDFFVSASATPAGTGEPQFNLKMKDLSGTTVATVPLTNINNYLQDVSVYNGANTKTEKFSLTTQFNTPLVNYGTYKFYLNYSVYGTNNFTVTLNSDNTTTSYLQIQKVNQGGDGLVMNMANNMPYGTLGIKLIDFVVGLQKKFNLVIYPNKTKPKEFIVETFNNWYNTGQIKSFDRYINLDDMIEVTPANNLAMNELNFGDKLDGDYISQQFLRLNNREFGKTYYVDTENFFSQGKFEVGTTFASSPLVYLAGTGQSGSALTVRAGFQASAAIASLDPDGASATSNIVANSEQVVRAIVAVYSPGASSDTDPVGGGYVYRSITQGTSIVFEANGGSPTTDILFKKINDSGPTTLATTSPYTYTVTAADMTQSTLLFTADVNSY